MKIKTSELIGRDLDWAVAKCHLRNFYFNEFDNSMQHRVGPGAQEK